MTRRVLVVCTANQCRSPMAEGLIRARADATGAHELEVVSAGTWAKEPAPATANALEVLSSRGIDLRGHLSREVSEDLLQWADLVLVMTEGHRQALVADFPDAREKITLLSALAGGNYDIADPVGRPLADYAATADELERIITTGWEIIVGDGAAS